jgi:hypothetical protein
LLLHQSRQPQRLSSLRHTNKHDIFFQHIG